MWQVIIGDERQTVATLQAAIAIVRKRGFGRVIDVETGVCVYSIE
jgi:hypothetical protein